MKLSYQDKKCNTLLFRGITYKKKEVEAYSQILSLTSLRV